MNKPNRVVAAVAASTLALCAILRAEAEYYEETVGNIDWVYTVSDGCASVGGGNSITAVPAATSGEIAIPATLGGYPVTSIGDHAFHGCSDLTSVTIPSSVTSIGTVAFWDCTSLTSVTIPNSIKSIDKRAFYGCNNLTGVYIDSLEAWCKIEFGQDEWANPLYCAHDLYLDGTLVEELTIPNTVTSIGQCAFIGCTSIKSVTIPGSVTSIDFLAFRECNGLTSVTLPDSLTSIGDLAFSRCTGLTDVTIPNSVTYLGYGAFEGCTCLMDIVIPDSVTSPLAAFSGCTSLAHVTIPNSITRIREWAFHDCISLTSVDIPNSVTNIGHNAFDGCTGLASIIIPDSVTSIGLDAFLHCNSLTDVTIGSSVTSIGPSVFCNCDKLTTITMRGDAPSDAPGAFYGLTPKCVVRLPRKNETYEVVDGKWQGMTVEWYGLAGDGASVTIGGESVTFADVGDGKTKIAMVADGTMAETITITVGGVDVTKGYDVKVDGTVATVRLMSPFEVGQDEKRRDAASPWEENYDGTVTLNVEVVPGLYYAAASAGSLGDLKCPGSNVAATENTTLTVAKPASDTQGFYKVWVSDAPMPAE